MKHSNYIISEKASDCKYLSVIMIWALLGNNNIASITHIWKGFFVTMIKEQALDKALLILKGFDKLSVIRECQSVTEYHNLIRAMNIERACCPIGCSNDPYHIPLATTCQNYIQR